VNGTLERASTVNFGRGVMWRKTEKGGSEEYSISVLGDFDSRGDSSGGKAYSKGILGSWE